MAGESLTIGSFQIVSSKRLTRTDYEYTLRASVANTGPAVKNVSATLTTAPAGTTIVDGSLSFGDVGKNATVPSSDTFVIRRTVTTTFNPAQFIWTISSEPVPFTIKILSPNALALFSAASLTVSGKAGPDVAEVGVNGIQGVVSPDGNWTVVSVPLKEGNNVLTAVGYSVGGETATDSIQVTLDSTAPRISITSPDDGAFFTEPKATITGNVNDTVVGTVNGDQATVTVNGVSAAVANRTFSVVDLPLSLGPNTITAVGADKAGNQSSVSITVFYNPVSGDRINLLSGNNQSAGIGELLLQPLVVQAVNGTGQPVPDKKVIFKVTENDGEITNDGNTARSLVVTGDSEGKAQVLYRLGTRAGAGNNQVSASIVGFEGEAVFSASATPGTPGLLVPDAGNNQIGVVSQPLPKPFVTIVVDAGNNRLHNVPVTFTAKEGGGSFAGQSSITVNSDSDGRSLAIFTIGSQAGNDNNIVEANFPGNTGAPVAFVASGRVAGNELETSISGVVLDNSDIPVPGVTMRILGFPDAVLSDEKGHFQIKPAPVGNVRLIADGSTATRPGSWVWLQFDIVTIAGQDSDIGRPVRLVQMDMEHALLVDETKGGTLTLPHAPGYSLNIAPGSVTFPNGSKSGHVSVTIVHPDKMPDPPSFGQQPRFLVSIQPANAVFNPPAQMCIPNLDSLPPGQKTDMYSYDHDMERFISIGTGTVSEDGLQVCSDPGNGVIKGGWHCGGNPQTAGTVATCPECHKCENNTCVPDDGAACDDHDPCTVDDKCVAGVCQGTPVTISPDEAAISDLCVGGSATVSVTITPNSASVTYESADPGIASVSGAGSSLTVTGVAEGSTTIRALIDGEVCGNVVTVSVVENPSFANSSAVAVTDGATPSQPVSGACEYGLTFPEEMSATIAACRDGNQWHAILKTLHGKYSLQARLLSGQTEVTGPAGNTTETNFCDQVTALVNLGFGPGCTLGWYMLQAVQDHEEVHAQHFLPALGEANVKTDIESLIEGLTVPHAPGMTAAAAATQIQALAGYNQALTDAVQVWLAEILVKAANDHDAGGATDTAEHAVVDPMVTSICDHATTNSWAACAACP